MITKNGIQTSNCENRFQQTAPTHTPLPDRALPLHQKSRGLLQPAMTDIGDKNQSLGIFENVMVFAS
jgi:hypothetical protein